MSEFIGARISLISRSDIRYSGTLHSINSDDSTVSLENVRSFGTEHRKTNPDEFVPPSDQLYEYIVFRGTDVKDLRIEEGPAPVKEEKPPAVPNDPAILGARPRPGNAAPGLSGPVGPQGPQGPQGPIGHAGPQNQQGPPPGAPGFGYFPPHMSGWGRAGAPGPGPGPFGGMPYPPPGWFPPGQEFPPMGHGPWGPYPFQPGPGGHPGAPGAPGAPGQGRQSANQTPSNQGPTQKPAPIGPAADRTPTTPSQPASASSEPKTADLAHMQPAAAAPPPPPVESKPTVEEVNATAASISNKSPTAAGQAASVPTGPKGNRPTQIMPAVPLPAALTAKVAQNQSGPKPLADQTNTAAAAAALRDATQAAKDAVARAMAQVDSSATTLQQAETNGVDNLTKRVNEMRINAARSGQSNRGGRGRGPRPAKVEVPDTDFDFASANAKFNKQDIVKEAVASSSLGEAGLANGADPEASDAIPPAEPAYNKNKSFFDNISSDLKDRENAAQRPGGAHWRGEETRKNIETFGLGSVDGGPRGGFRRGRGRGRRDYRGGRGGSGGYRSRGPQTAPSQ
ncbi:hypothetical protein MYCTH_2316492 [Thermothelomyces thermophilus ATCC 42464]|uniref:Uncharacterized protein n=1 Tax=Thermothelomyces thermophilus (strain ATCC 42464 / BCRC 31852 / DSM 1799) TaxID=573729 RepID=G2QPF4_THET4|nr:uncharacterized protein MYCTH_2316492 [Thermothelomyces thermophilus ATCC 42464]AEO61467.1 hypothetical protein MYCTH_2316492 [Thermothelomyces thermophilus ATCC 42464]